MLSFLAEKYNLVMDAKSVVKEIKAENNEEVISPSSSADDHESHEGGSTY
jgi:hypothetical protein